MDFYQALTETCQRRGWRTWWFAIDDGCRGFAGKQYGKLAGRTLEVVRAEL